MLGARNRPKTSKIAFFEASKRLSKISLNFAAIFDRIHADFGVFGMSKNEEKCGRVCSDSIFSVRNIQSNFDAFWVGFGQGLGCILGGFWSHVGTFLGARTHVGRHETNGVQKSMENRAVPKSPRDRLGTGSGPAQVRPGFPSA